MRIYLLSKFLILIPGFLLRSWGRVGHETVGYIAVAHLTPKTAAAVNELLGSNRVGTHFYDENPGGKKLGQAYYDVHIGMVRQRIDPAGIRRAGILNQSSDPQKTKSKLLSAVQKDTTIKGTDRDKFKTPPEKLFRDRTICVRGCGRNIQGPAGDCGF